ncbi:MAG: TonB-dependent receptor [Gammaproteobacteria bacterium]|jgi:vitamin B12 transporter
MNYRIRYVLILLIAFSHPASTNEALNNIEDIIITASLEPISIRRSANSVTVINEKDLRLSATVNVIDILRGIPGFAVSQSGVQGSQAQIRVRGAEANHLLVLIDGVEANNPAQSDELNWGTLAASDISRIEVIRGPQSAMFGSDAMSGVINIITKNTINPKDISIFSEAGSFNTKNNGLSIGFKNHDFSVRLGLSQLRTDGENVSRVGNEKDGYENQNITLKSNLSINNKIQTSFSLRQSDGMNEYDSDVDFDGLIDDQEKVAKFKNTTLGFKTVYLSSDNRRQHQVSYSQSNNDNEDFKISLLESSTYAKKEQLRLISSVYWNEFVSRASVLAEHESEDFKQRGQINDFGIYGIFDPNQDRRRETTSLAFEYRADIFNSITLATSIRRDNNSQFKNSNSFRAEIIYDSYDGLRVRGTYGTAVKNPTFTERFGFYTNFIGNPLLQPEKSTNFEVGLDQNFLNEKLMLSATIFNSELENEIDGNALDPVTFGYTAINKDGPSKRKGLELNAIINCNEKLSINASYTFTDSEELNAEGIYQTEVRRPKHIASMNLSWQKSEFLNISANIQHNGSQQDVVFPSNVKLSKYTVVNLSANLNINKKLDAYLRLANLFDEKYEEVYGYQTLGFGAHIGIRYNF